MPYRWVICPVIVDGGARKPKVSILVDPGIPPIDTVDGDGNPIQIRKTYRHTSVISDGNGKQGENDAIALSLVRFVDPADLDSDVDIDNLSDEDDLTIENVRTELDHSPAQRGTPPGRMTSILARLQARGVDVAGLNVNSLRVDVLNRGALLIKPKPGQLKFMVV